ncbi:mitogen-activated protein kinase kinase kinase 1-like [Lotus japonicus]|uniref:mitogen-activated protein kinase kinase kinase 1-like n=1 Tax=Lotus japonicus TaxID=34305 RepID=UPI00258B4E08|nr:mitogen-activated protein kinase kinase kinase 1-like [Lotus japonicus]
MQPRGNSSEDSFLVIVVSSSQRSRSRRTTTTMEWKWKTKKQPPQPRLQRLNAKRNIDYEPPTPTPPSSTSSSPPFHSLYDPTSLRVMGIDGEFDRIFQSLGLSGPEDFAIPTADWEARKSRSADSNPNPKPNRNCNRNVPVTVLPVSPKLETPDLRNGNFGDGVCGIKGFRPPLLATTAGGAGVVRSPSSSGEHDGRGGVGRLRFGERSVVFTDSGSFSTSHDDDSDVGGERGCSASSSANGWVTLPFSSWQKGDLLGKGSFGTVYEGFTDDGNFYAVKEVSLLDEGTQGKQSVLQLQQEISLLSRFKHDNIVRYFGSHKDESTLYIFLEFVSKGSLASLYQKYRLNDSQVSAYTRQILNGLKYLHDRDIVHRDIKGANILVDVSGAVKLADFGLAKATKLNDLKSSKGSPYWMAPEVVNLKNEGYGLAADIWSLGCTVLELLIRQPPYSDLEGMQAIFRIGKGEPPPIPEHLSEDARDFILKCLQVNPNKRPTAAQLLDHPFIRMSASQASQRT